jgi:5-methylcytosine-specific restriction endonuclease McrA
VSSIDFSPPSYRAASSDLTISISPLGLVELADENEKTCTKCGLSKALEYFHKRALSKDGHMSQCKNCVNSRIKANYDKDPAKKITETRKYHLEHQEWSKKTQATWHKTNRDIRYARVKNRLKNDSEFLTYRRNIQANSERKRRAIKAGTQVVHITSAQYAEKLSLFNNSCWICEQDITNLEWDHVQPLSKGGAHVIDNLQPACDKCNGRKSDTWPFTDKMKEAIATEVKALTNLEEVMP